MSHNRIAGKRGVSLFTSEDICKMRRMVRDEHKTHQYVANQFDISRAAVSFIVNGKTYRDVVCK